MAPSTIVVIGGLTRRIIAEADRMPKKGQTVTTSTYDSHTGGRGAFTAVTAYRQSHYKATDDQLVRCVCDDGEIEVRLIGAYGEDDIGPPMKNRISGVGVNTDGVREMSGTKTSMSFVVVDEYTKEHKILFCPGANHALSSELFDEEEKLIKECGGQKPDLIIVNCELKQSTVEKIISTASSADVPVLLNLVPELHLFADSFEHLTHLVVHKAEAKGISKRCPEGDDDPHSWDAFAQEFLDRGVENVVITLGSGGAYCSNKSGTKKHIPGQEHSVAGNRVGVGETFVGAYAVEYIKHKRTASTSKWDIETAVKRGCQAAMLNLEHDGCIYPVPWANHVDRLESEITDEET